MVLGALIDSREESCVFTHISRESECAQYARTKGVYRGHAGMRSALVHCFNASVVRVGALALAQV